MMPIIKQQRQHGGMQKKAFDIGKDVWGLVSVYRRRKGCEDGRVCSGAWQRLMTLAIVYVSVGTIKQDGVTAAPEQSCCLLHLQREL